MFVVVYLFCCFVVDVEGVFYVDGECFVEECIVVVGDGCEFYYVCGIDYYI